MLTFEDIFQFSEITLFYLPVKHKENLLMKFIPISLFLNVVYQLYHFIVEIVDSDLNGFVFILEKHIFNFD